MIAKYFGITHPKGLLKKWQKSKCQRGQHLFDEVVGGDWSHYLVCDYCQLMVHIKSVDFTYYRYKENK